MLHSIGDFLAPAALKIGIIRKLSVGRGADVRLQILKYFCILGAFFLQALPYRKRNAGRMVGST